MKGLRPGKERDQSDVTWPFAAEPTAEVDCQILSPGLSLLLHPEMRFCIVIAWLARHLGHLSAKNQFKIS
jgi:hypothetical protein